MYIVFDLDGTLIKSQEEMMKLASKKLKSPISVKNWTIYNPKHCFNEMQYAALKSVWATPAVYENCEAFDGAIDSMKKLVKSVNNFVEICTYSGFENYGELTIAKFGAIQRLGINCNKFISTKDVKNNLDCDILVEDCIETLLNSNAEYKFLHTRPWNKAFNAKENRIIRFNNFAEFDKIAEKIGLYGDKENHRKQIERD